MIPTSDALNETVKNVLEYILPYDIICMYTWTGLSVLGTHDNAKKAFNELLGIQELVKFIVNNDGEKQPDELILRSMSIFMKRSTQRRDRELSKRLRVK